MGSASAGSTSPAVLCVLSPGWSLGDSTHRTAGLAEPALAEPLPWVHLRCYNIHYSYSTTTLRRSATLITESFTLSLCLSLFIPIFYVLALPLRDCLYRGKDVGWGLNKVNVFSMAKLGRQGWGCTKDRRTKTRHRHYQTALGAKCSAFNWINDVCRQTPTYSSACPQHNLAPRRSPCSTL